MMTAAQPSERLPMRPHAYKITNGMQLKIQPDMENAEN
jgi:hypothetical protein